MKIKDTREEFFENLDEGTVFEYNDIVSPFGMKLDEDTFFYCK